MNPGIYSAATTGARTSVINYHSHTHKTKECTFVCDSCYREFHKEISIERDCPTICTTCSGEDAIIVITFIIGLLCCIAAIIINRKNN